MYSPQLALRLSLAARRLYLVGVGGRLGSGVGWRQSVGEKPSPIRTIARAPLHRHATELRPLSERKTRRDPPGDLAADVVRDVDGDVVAEELHPPRVLAVDGAAQLRLRGVPLLSGLEGDVGRRVVDDGEGGHPKVVAQPGHEPGRVRVGWGGGGGLVGPPVGWWMAAGGTTIWLCLCATGIQQSPACAAGFGSCGYTSSTAKTIAAAPATAWAQPANPHALPKPGQPDTTHAKHNTHANESSVSTHQYLASPASPV
jgi:hypothetical protein